MARANDRVFFAVAAAAGALIVLGSVLPTFVVGLDAAVGAGEEQRGYSFDRTLRAATYLEPGSLAFPAAGVVLVVAGLLAAGRPRSWTIVLVAAVATGMFVHVLRTSDYLGEADEPGVYGCEQPRLEDCIGFLAPAVRDLRADILRMPIAAEREFHGPERDEHRTEGRIGWTVASGAIAVFTLVAWFRTAHLVTRSTRLSLLLVAGGGLAVLLYLVVRGLTSLE